MERVVRQRLARRECQAILVVERGSLGMQSKFVACKLSSTIKGARLCQVAAKCSVLGALQFRCSRARLLLARAAPSEDNGRPRNEGPTTEDSRLSLLSSLQLEAQLETELQQLESELMQVQLEATSQVDGAREQLQESRRKADLLEAIVGALRERLRREEDRNAALEAAVEAGRVELARSEAERKDLQQRITGLRSELVETQTKLSVAANEAERRALSLNLQRLEFQVSESRRRESSLGDRVAALGGEVAALQARLSLSSAGKASVDAAFNAVLMEVQAAQARLAAAAAQLQQHGFGAAAAQQPAVGLAAAVPVMAQGAAAVAADGATAGTGEPVVKAEGVSEGGPGVAAPKPEAV